MIYNFAANIQNILHITTISMKTLTIFNIENAFSVSTKDAFIISTTLFHLNETPIQHTYVQFLCLRCVLEL